MSKEKSDQNAVAELTREGLYKENKWLWEENKKLKEENLLQLAEIRRLREHLGEYKKLKEEVKDLVERNIELDKKYMLVLTENRKLREELSVYDREYFDEDKKAKNIFIDKSGKVIKGGEFTTLC